MQIYGKNDFFHAKNKWAIILHKQKEEKTYLHVLHGSLNEILFLYKNVPSLKNNINWHSIACIRDWNV